MKVVLLDTDQLVPQLVCDFGGMQITRSLIGFVRPYDDGMGLIPSRLGGNRAKSVIGKTGEVDWTYAAPSLEGVIECLIDTRTQT
jgi:hypothetical protein